MIARDSTVPFQEQRILALEYHCRQMLGQGGNGSPSAADLDSASGEGVKDQATKLIELTARLFPPGALEVAREHDPDSPNNENLVVEVVASGEFQDVLCRKHQWHDAVAALLGEEATCLSLIAYPQ